MKKSKILAGVLVFLGVGCLAFGVTRYFEDTKVQQPAVLQEGVEDIGTGMIQADEPVVMEDETSSEDTGPEGVTQTEPSEDKGGDGSEED